MGAVKGRSDSGRRAARRLIYLSVAVLLSVWALSPSVGLYKQQGEIGRLEQEVAEVKEKNEELRRDKLRLTSDEYVELMARKELGLVRPGQQPYLLLSPGGETASDEDGPSRPSPTAKADNPPEKGLADSIIEKLGKLVN